jgi:hypothetical protein
MYLSRVGVCQQAGFLHRTFPHGIAHEKAITSSITTAINRAMPFSIFSQSNFTLSSDLSLTASLNISRFKMSTNISQSDDSVLQQVLDLVRSEKLLCDAGDTGAQKVVEFVLPKDLETCLGGLVIGSDPTNDADVKDFLEKVVRYSVKTSHHRFYNQVCSKRPSIHILCYSVFRIILYQNRSLKQFSLCRISALHSGCE